jgi:hypothetical protein
MKHAHRLAMDDHGELAQMLRDAITDARRYGDTLKEVDAHRALIAACNRLDSERLQDEYAHGNVMGRIAIALFGDQNNRTDEDCVTKIAEVVRERDRLRQHLHDEHQRHIGTMDERDALAALLRDCLPELDGEGVTIHRVWAALAKN